MARYIGEYDCKIDAKGRVMLPAALRKQIPEEMRDKLIVNRGLDACLVMYAVPDWQAETEKLQQLNQFNKVDRDFIRLYHNGATEIEVDSASRILIPKKLLEYADIKSDMVMLGFGNKIELWAADKYKAMMQVNSEDFSAMAEKLLGTKGGLQMGNYHEPVMLAECVNGLNINPNGTYVDATFGGGGHSRAILDRLDKGKLIAFDQDADAKTNAINDKRFILVAHNFRFMRHFLTYLGSIPVDGVLADLGISSHQINEGERGFAHRLDGKLDMRMNNKTGSSAAELINDTDSDVLLKIFREYGELDRPGVLVKNLIQRRALGKIATTAQLREVAIQSAPRHKENQYLAQVYQALRIAVNDEINALNEWLESLPSVIKPGGRLVILSYHSLEDRPVKNFIQHGRTSGEGEKDMYGNISRPFKPVTKGAIRPSNAETDRNPRARSAKLRIAERI